MRSSRYNVIVENHPRPGFALVYNTLTGTAVFAPTELAVQLQKPTFDPSGLDETSVNALLSQGVAVEDTANELNDARRWFQDTVFDTSTLFSKILTTYDCQLDCVYCYEKAYRKPVYMTSETANSIVEWHIHKLDELQSSACAVTFYGGEPLLNLPAVDLISRKLHDFCQATGRNFKMGFITNAVLLTPHVVRALVPLGLSRVWFTVDGPKEVHDRRRYFQDRTGTYDVIMENLRFVVENSTSQAYIGVNFDAQNMGSIGRWFEALATDPIFRRVYFDVAPTQDSKDSQPHCQHYLISDSEAREYIKSILAEATRMGLQVLGRFDSGVCGVASPAGWVIDPNGKLFKCSWLLERDEFAVGHVHGTAMTQQNSQLSLFHPWEDCLQCKYVPVCGGGCLYKAQIRNGDWRRRFCDQKYYDEVWVEQLKLRHAKLEEEE